MSAIQWIQAIGGIVSLIGVLFLIYKQFADPDIKAANQIDLLKQGCELKHKSLDELWGEKFSNMEQSVAGIYKSFTLLQENDLKHIETSIRSLEDTQTKILTIMDERFPKK